LLSSRSSRHLDKPSPIETARWRNVSPSVRHKTSDRSSVDTPLVRRSRVTNDPRHPPSLTMKAPCSILTALALPALAGSCGALGDEASGRPTTTSSTAGTSTGASTGGATGTSTSGRGGATTSSAASSSAAGGTAGQPGTGGGGAAGHGGADGGGD